MIKYKKSKKDIDRELHDLENNHVMIYLKNKDKFKFNVGDILVQKVLTNAYHAYRHGEDQKWVTVKVNKTHDVPKRYVYAFENEFGIGYIRQLSIDGKKFTSKIICLANVDPRYSMFELDPEYADTVILGGDFIEQINSRYIEMVNFRKNAMQHNKSILIKRKNLEKWVENLKIGDIFYSSWKHEQLYSSKWQVVKITKTPWESLNNYEQILHSKMENKDVTFISAVSEDNVTRDFSLYDFRRQKVSSLVPLSLKPKI